MKGFRIFLATFAITLTLGALAQDSVIPSRPRFLSVGVGTAAGSTNGNITATGTVTAANASVSGTATVGTLTATSGTVGGSAICRADGTNCPVVGATQSSTVSPLTFNSGNFTAGVTGCTTGTGPFVVWSRRGWTVEIQMSKFSCTSNSLLFNITGFPAEIRTSSNSIEMLVPATNNTTEQGIASCHMGSNGALSCSWRGSTWTASGTKAIGSELGGTSVGFNYALAW